MARRKKETRGRKRQIPVGTVVKYADFVGRLLSYRTENSRRLAEIDDAGTVVSVPAHRIVPAGRVIAVKVWS